MNSATAYIFKSDTGWNVIFEGVVHTPTRMPTLVPLPLPFTTNVQWHVVANDIAARFPGTSVRYHGSQAA